MMNRWIFAAAVFTLALIFVGTPWAQDDLVVRLEKGMETFESVCGRCHGVDRPQALNMDRPEWARIVAQMEERGATMTDQERELILDYLGIRNVFLTKCTVCHTKERIYDRQQAFEKWKQTVEGMAAKSPDLMTEGEASSIIAYLSVVLGTPPESR